MPKTNREISSIFEQMSVLCELNGDNIFKIRAYQKAANVISNLEKNVIEMKEDELLSIRGIGKGIASHIKEIKSRGTFEEFEELKSKYPPGILEIVNLRGLGAKRVKVLYEKFHIDSVNKLLEFAKKGKVKEIDGFGEKIEKSIIESIEKKIDMPKRFLFHIAKRMALEIIDYMKNLGYKNIEYAGSLRRCKETVGDIDILCVGNQKAIKDFIKSPFVKMVLSEGELKASVILNGEIQCDFRVFKKDEYGAALCYFTGSKQHNIRLREIANKNNFVLNEYGLFKNYGSKEKIAGWDEKEIYQKLGLQYIPPELREDSGEIELALSNRIPKLVDISDIKGDIHCHTSYTDGANSVEEVIDFLAKRYEWSFIGDHSVPLSFVKGLDFKNYISSRNEVFDVAQKYSNKQFDRSIETEILKDGSLAFKEEELKEISLVIGAVHTSLRLNKDEQTRRVIKALTNPYCDVAAHLTQRIIMEREEMDMDYEAVFEAAYKSNAVFEINGQPDRLDLKDINVKKAKSLGLKLVLSSDAHSLEQFDYISYALNNARRAGLCKDDLLNCLSYKDFKNFIKENRKKRGGL